MAYNAEVLADSPIHYFKLDETTGTTFANSGSNSYTTALSKGTGVTINQSDTISGKSALFDGSANGYATAFALSGQFPSSGTTVELWYKGTDTGTLAKWGSSSSFWQVAVNASGFVQFSWGTQVWNATTGAVNNGQWHHIVVSATNSTGTYQIWVDKVKVYDSGAGQSVANFSSNGDMYLGDNTTAAIAGKIDEFAVYNSVLSSTRIAAHYNAAPLPTNVTVDVTTVTGTAQAQDVEVPNASVSVPTATATAQAIDATVPDQIVVNVPTATASAAAIEPRVFRTVAVSPSADYFRDGGVAVTTSPIVLNQTTDLAIFGISLPPQVTADTVGPVKFNFHVAGIGAGTPTTFAFKLAQLTAPVTDINNVSVGPSVSFNVAGASFYEVDATSVFDYSTFQGFVIWSDAFTSGTQYKQIDTIENATPANRPYMNVAYEVAPMVVDFTADTPTVSAAAVDALPEVHSNVETAVATATASVSAVDATATSVVTPDAVVSVETPTATLATYPADVAVPVVIDLSDAEISVQAYDTTIAQTSSAVVEADTARFTITHLGLTDVNGEPIVPTEDEDKFFVNTKRLFAQNRPGGATSFGVGGWFRLNETSGTTAVDRTGIWSGSYDGGCVIGLNGGPNGRKYVHLDGTGVISQGDGYLGTEREYYDYNGTLQFAIRTTKKDQFIMRMDDIRRGTIGATDTPPRDLYLKNGRLEYRVWTESSAAYSRSASMTVATALTGFKDIADGEWHLITLASGAGADANTKVEVWVDDHLDVRRNSYGVSFPDWIGGRPGGGGYRFEDYYTMPQSEWFVGDISEVIYFDGQHMQEDDVLRQYDTIFGYDPVYADAAKAFVKANDAIAKGNSKRVLTINFHVHETQLSVGYGQRFAFNGLAYGGNLQSGVQVGEYQVFQVSAWNPLPGAGYYDAVTDEQRLLDLDIDVNLEDFDIINVVNYPQGSADWDLFNEINGSVLYGGLSGRQQAEKIVHRIKKFVVDGGGLFLTDPSLAVDLGMIDKVESVSVMRELGNPNFDDGLSPAGYDLRGAKVNPWGGSADGASTTIWSPRPSNGPTAGYNYEQLAEFYDDEHANNFQRVRKLVPGLTDIPGSILVDSVSFWGYRGDGEMHAEKYAARPNGLSIGDEFRLMGTPQSGRGGGFAGLEATGRPVGASSRYYNLPVTPIANVKAGSVVTSLGATTWEGDSQVPNPYKDYAVTVVVEPGDTLGGEQIKGRVFMNFTESFAEMAPFMQHGIEDVIPPNEEITFPAYRETEESRQWNWSMWRGSWAGNSAGTDSGQKSRVSINSNGDLVVSGSGGGSNLTGITYTSRWPQRPVEQPTMHYRGLKWLGDSIDRTGNATVGLATVTVTAGANEATVEAQKSTEVELATARTQAVANNLSDQTYADAEILVFTPGVTVSAVPFTEAVDLSTATITAQAYDDFESIFNDADLVVLRLHDSQAILYMEDK